MHQEEIHAESWLCLSHCLLIQVSSKKQGDCNPQEAYVPLIISVLQPNLGGIRLFIWLHKSLRIDSTRGSRALHQDWRLISQFVLN